MRILSLAVMALVASGGNGFTMPNSNNGATSSALHMSSYLDSLSAYSAYQKQQQQQTQGKPNVETMVVANPPVAGSTVAPPPKMSVVPQEVVVVKEPPKQPVEEKLIVKAEATIEPKNPLAAPAGAAAAAASRPKAEKAKPEVKPKLPPPPPGAVVDPSKVAFGSDRRSKDVQKELETNQLINRIGVFVTISLYVGVPLALFGLPPEMFLSKVENKLVELTGGDPSGNTREELVKKGIVRGDEDASFAFGGAFEGIANTKVGEVFQRWVDREMELSKHPAKVDVESVRSRLLMSDYYSGNYKSSGETIFSTATQDAAVVVTPATPVPLEETPVYPSTPLNIVTEQAPAVATPTPQAEASQEQVAPPQVATDAVAATPIEAAVTAPEVTASPPPVEVPPAVVPQTATAAAPAAEVKPVSWQSNEEMQSYQAQYNQYYQGYAEQWQGQSYDYQQEVQNQEPSYDYQAYQNSLQHQVQDNHYQAQNEAYQAQYNNYNYHKAQYNYYSQLQVQSNENHQWQTSDYDPYRDESLF